MALYAFCLLLGVLPVLLFLGALVALDSYKLVHFGVVLRLVALGGGVALLCLYLNPFLYELLGWSASGYSNYVAPVVEEGLKGAAIVIALVHRRLGFLVDAAIWGFAIGAGFAAVENIHYFVSLDLLDPTLWTVRGFGTALMHGGAAAIAGVISRQLTERLDSHRALLFVPGLAVAAAIHSAFNHFFLSPNASALVMLVALPAIFVTVFWISERATRSWLGAGFDTDQQLLRQIYEDNLDDSRVGRYLEELKSRFEPGVVADMLCLILVHLELSIKAKGVLMLKKAGVEPPRDDTIEPRFAEMRYLEGTIGKTGLLALHPIFHMSSRDLWQLHMLGKKGGGLTNFLVRRR